MEHETSIPLSHPFLPDATVNFDSIDNTSEHPSFFSLNKLHGKAVCYDTYMFNFDILSVVNLMCLYLEGTGRTSFADMGVIKIDYIGRVSDTLGQEASAQEGSIQMDELPESNIVEENKKVDGQFCVSLKEMDNFIEREESHSLLMDTNETTQIKRSENKLQQLIPPLSHPSLLPSPTTLSLLHYGEIPMFNYSVPLPYRQEQISQEEFQKEILSLNTQEEDVMLGLASHEQTFSEQASSTVSTNQKVDVDNIMMAAFVAPVEDIASYDGECQDKYGKYFNIIIFNFNRRYFIVNILYIYILKESIIYQLLNVANCSAVSVVSVIV